MIAQSFRILFAVAATVVVTTTLQAQGSSTPSFPDPYWPDLHQNNRAVGFGSILMDNGGYDVNAWKELRAFNWCDAVIGLPDDGAISRPIGRTLAERLAGSSSSGDDGSSGGDDGDDDNSSEFACWDVLATTAYQLVECPDGRAYIARSGVGVQLIDRNNGELFGWDEGILCNDDGLGGGTNLNKQRPLDLGRIRKIAK